MSISYYPKKVEKRAREMGKNTTPGLSTTIDCNQNVAESKLLIPQNDNKSSNSLKKRLLIEVEGKLTDSLTVVVAKQSRRQL